MLGSRRRQLRKVCRRFSPESDATAVPGKQQDCFQGKQFVGNANCVTVTQVSSPIAGTFPSSTEIRSQKTPGIAAFSGKP